MENKKKATARQMERYPLYLAYLKKLQSRGVSIVTSPSLAKIFHSSEEQVRKDLHLISRSSGKPGSGRNVHELIEDIEDYLGYHHQKYAIVCGVGNLGSAFMGYTGFSKAGIEVLGGFDIDKSKTGTFVRGKRVFSMKKLQTIVKDSDIRIAILTTPVEAAQECADQLVAAGIRAILNFAPTHLQVPEDINVLNVDLAATLSVLAQNIIEKESEYE